MALNSSSTVCWIFLPRLFISKHLFETFVDSSPQKNLVYSPSRRLVKALAFVSIALTLFALLYIHFKSSSALLLPPAPPTKDSPERVLLSVHLTPHALTLEATIKETNRTCALDWAQHRSYFSTYLGAPRLHAPPFLPWSHRVAAMVHGCVIGEYLRRYRGNITDILVLGESAGTESLDLANVVHRALMEMQTEEPTIHMAKEEGLAFVAGEGAAEMAWGVLHGPVLETNRTCMECGAENRRKYENSIQYGRWGQEMTTGEWEL
jgi:hypothetical protein